MAEKHTSIAVEITPVAIWALVNVCRDSDTGDEAVLRLASAVERSGHLTLAGALEQHVERRSEEREAREEAEAEAEEQRKIDEGDWSDNQHHFIREAREMGLPLRLYSGRGMFGEECPAAVGLIRAEEFEAGCCEDSMGMDVVVYARS